MYNAFWRLALFVRGQSFSVKTFDRSRNGCQVIGEGAGNDFRGPSLQALSLPPRVSFSRAIFSCAHYFQEPATQARFFTKHDLFVIKIYHIINWLAIISTKALIEKSWLHDILAWVIST